jgi:hypothetical protein
MLALEQYIFSYKNLRIRFLIGSFFQPQCGLCSTQSGADVSLERGWGTVKVAGEQGITNSPLEELII